VTHDVCIISSVCNLVDNSLGVDIVAKLLNSVDKTWLSTWFVNNYIQKCAMLCPDTISSLFSDVSTNVKLQKAVSAIVDWRPNVELLDTWLMLHRAEVALVAVRRALSACCRWMTEATKACTLFSSYLTAVVFLHVAYKISTAGFSNELMHVIATIVTKFISIRRHLSECRKLSLDTATELMKAVANSSRQTRQIPAAAAAAAAASDVNTSQLHVVNLLQQSAFQHLIMYRQLVAEYFSDSLVTADFEALYAYKHGNYQQCLQLCTHNIRTLLLAITQPVVLTYPEFIQLLDDDIVSLTALTLLVKTECRDGKHNEQYNTVISQRTLSLYLMTQCQLKLRHSVTSVAKTLHSIELIQSIHPVNRTLDDLTLKLIKHKLLRYIADDDLIILQLLSMLNYLR